MNFSKKMIVFLFFVFSVVFNPAITTAYGFWNSLSDNDTNQLTIGDWGWISELIGPQLSSDLSTYIDNELLINPNSNLQYIYSQSGNLSNLTATMENISFYNYNWDITGIGTATPVTTMGYISLIDREMNGGSFVHPIITPYTTTPTYPEYNFFTSYDSNNINTNNQYSLRMNYGVTISSDTVINSISSVSFYAAIGLSSPDDTVDIVSRTFDVEISTDGFNWISIGSASPSVATSSNHSFDLYNFSVPQAYQNQDLYLRIQFNGESIKQGKLRNYSRLIIDELNIIVD